MFDLVCWAEFDQHFGPPFAYCSINNLNVWVFFIFIRIGSFQYTSPYGVLVASAKKPVLIGALRFSLFNQFMQIECVLFAIRLSGWETENEKHIVLV